MLPNIPYPTLPLRQSMNCYIMHPSTLCKRCTLFTHKKYIYHAYLTSPQAHEKHSPTNTKKEKNDRILSKLSRTQEQQKYRRFFFRFSAKFTIKPNLFSFLHSQQKKYVHSCLKVGMLLSCDNLPICCSYSFFIMQHMYPMHIKLGKEVCKRAQNA